MSETHDRIFYKIIQCVADDKKTVKGEKVYFSYRKNGEFGQLPAGCPPPVVSPPVEENPCEMGYNVGQTIAKTISNIVVPKFLEDDPENPVRDTTEFKQITELKNDKKNFNNLSDFNKEQQKIVEDFEKLIQNFTDEKIECFAEHVIPVKKMDIEIICTTSGAHKSVEDALKAALGDQVTCEHVGCSEIEERLKNGDTGFGSAIDIGGGAVITKGESDYVEGKEDVNGNVQVPTPNEPYMIVHSSSSNYPYISSHDELVSGEGNCRSGSADQKFRFEKVMGHFVRILNKDGKYFRMAGKDSLVLDADIDNTKLEQYLFRIVQNIGGSVTFNSKSNPHRVIGQLEDKVVPMSFGKQNLD